MSITKLFENERLIVSNFILASGEKVFCKHSYNSIRWQVGEALHQRDENEVVEIPDKHVSFIKSGTEFHLTNKSSDESRHILFEIKQEPKHTEEEVANILTRAIYPTDVGTKLLLENRYCRVWDFCLAPDEGDPNNNAHHHVLDYVFVYVAPGRLLGYHPDGKPGLFDSVNENNDVSWFDIPPNAPEDISFAHGGKNGYKDKPMREYLVELK